MRKNVNIQKKREVARRLREIRISSQLTQEQFAEVIDISLSAYKKLESAENQISINGLCKITEEFNVTSDYILFGKFEDANDTWKMIMNCSEDDKIFFLLRLSNYFSIVKEVKYNMREEQIKYDGNILKYLRAGIIK